MKKPIVLILSLLFTLCIVFSGCAYTVTPEEGTAGSSNKETTSSGSETVTEDETVPQDAYTVTLALPEGYTEMPDLTGIQAKWTNSTSVYTADFDSSGFAWCTGLDGEYSVTVSGTIENYSYDPNIYEATGTAEGRKVTVELIRLVNFLGAGTNLWTGRATANKLGVYRITYTKQGQEFYFLFDSSSYTTTTGYVFRIETLADIVANEINPTMYIHLTSNGMLSDTISGGSSYNGSFTKNVSYEFSKSSQTNNGYAYKMTIDTIDEDYSEPKYLDIRISMGDEYSDDDYWNDMGGLYTHAETEEYNSDYTVPGGTMTWLSSLADGDLSNLGDAKKGDDGFYYIQYNGKWYMVFAELNSCHYSRRDAENDDGGTTYYNFYSDDDYANSFCQSTNTYYYDVISDYMKTATEEGYHPVTEQLHTFLQAYADRNPNIFYDGLIEGSLELSEGLTSNNANQWMFACGIYL